MQTAIVKWGNSQGIRLPKVFLQNLNISENETVEVLIQGESIIIKKSSPKRSTRHRTTQERLMEFYGPEYNQNCMKQSELDWGTPVGKELW